MGKRGGHRRESNSPSVLPKPLSLREEKTGKKQANTTNVKSKLKLEHLQSLAVWASGEGSVPSLAALFGHRLASAYEALGLQPDPSLFSCQRCETVLQPGFNCTIRIKKNQVKSRRKHKKPKISTQNSVVYKCHFCSHGNLKRGTPEGHMKEICPPRAKPYSNAECGKSQVEQSTSTADVTRAADEDGKGNEISLPAISEDSPILNSAITPVKTKITLEGKKRRRSKLGTKNPSEPESDSTINDGKTVGASSKRRGRTSWTSLKEIAERTEYDSGQNVADAPIPFSLLT